MKKLCEIEMEKKTKPVKFRLFHDDDDEKECEHFFVISVWKILVCSAYEMENTWKGSIIWFT